MATVIPAGWQHLETWTFTINRATAETAKHSSNLRSILFILVVGAVAVLAVVFHFRKKLILPTHPAASPLKTLKLFCTSLGYLNRHKSLS